MLVIGRRLSSTEVEAAEANDGFHHLLFLAVLGGSVCIEGQPAGNYNLAPLGYVIEDAFAATVPAHNIEPEGRWVSIGSTVFFDSNGEGSLFVAGFREGDVLRVLPYVTNDLNLIVHGVISW